MVKGGGVKVTSQVDFQAPGVGGGGGGWELTGASAPPAFPTTAQNQGTAQHLTQSPSRGKGTREEVTASQSTSLDSPNTKSSLKKHVWS